MLDKLVIDVPYHIDIENESANRTNPNATMLHCDLQVNLFFEGLWDGVVRKEGD